MLNCRAMSAIDDAGIDRPVVEATPDSPALTTSGAAEASGSPVARRPSIVLLHGVGMGHRMWQPQLDTLGQDFQVIAPDLPGFGRATDAGPFSVGRAAAAVADLIREQCGGRAHVCGLSLGAVVAVQLAATAPDLLESVMLSGAVVHAPVLARMQSAIFRLTPRARLMSALAKQFVPRDQPAIRTAAEEDLALLGKDGLLQIMSQIARIDLRPVLPTITTRTLVVCGSRDKANLRAARLIAGTVRGAQLRIVEGVGHVWNLEAPERFDEVLGNFVGAAASAS